jgi:hypothetical protein
MDNSKMTNKETIYLGEPLPAGLVWVRKDSRVWIEDENGNPLKLNYSTNPEMGMFEIAETEVRV